MRAFHFVAAALAFLVSVLPAYAEDAQVRTYKVLDGITGVPVPGAAVRIENVPGDFVSISSGEVTLVVANGTKLTIEADGYETYFTVADDREVLYLAPDQDDEFILEAFHLRNPNQPISLLGLPDQPPAAQVYLVAMSDYLDEAGNPLPSLVQAAEMLTEATAGRQVYTAVAAAPAGVVTITVRTRPGLSGATYEVKQAQGRDGIWVRTSCEVLLPDPSRARDSIAQETIAHEAGHCFGFVMHPTMPGGIMSARNGRPAFSHDEGLAMRMALLRRSGHGFRDVDRRLLGR